MDVSYLSLSELQKLMESPSGSDVVKADKSIKCISTVEEFYLIECIKKEDISAQVLRLVRNRKCQLYNAIDCGYIVTADLSIDSLENGLFKVGEDYYSFELWDDAINLTVDPATSAKMISLRSFDLIWETSLYTSTMNNKA